MIPSWLVAMDAQISAMQMRNIKNNLLPWAETRRITISYYYRRGNFRTADTLNTTERERRAHSQIKCIQGLKRVCGPYRNASTFNISLTPSALRNNIGKKIPRCSYCCMVGQDDESSVHNAGLFFTRFNQNRPALKQISKSRAHLKKWMIVSLAVEWRNKRIFDDVHCCVSRRSIKKHIFNMGMSLNFLVVVEPLLLFILRLSSVVVIWNWWMTRANISGRLAVLSSAFDRFYKRLQKKRWISLFLNFCVIKKCDSPVMET